MFSALIDGWHFACIKSAMICQGNNARRVTTEIPARFGPWQSC
jgi:hypothetical protein